MTVPLGGVVSGVAGTVAGGLTSGVAGGLTGGLAGPLAGGVFGAGVGAVMDSFTQWISGGAVSLLDWVSTLLAGTTSMDLTGRWFTSHYDVIAVLSLLAAAPMVFVTIIQSITRQDISIALRCVLLHLPLAILGTAVAVELVQLTLSLVDQMCQAIAGSGESSTGPLAALENFLLAGSGLPGLVSFILELVVAFGAFFLWIELALRSAAVAITVLFLPLSLLGMVMPATIPWCRRLLETLAALILSKLVIVATLSLAGSALSVGSGLDGFMEGVALLLLATFAPFAVLRLIPAVEAGAVHHLEGLARRGATSPLRVASATVNGVSAVAALPGAVSNLRAAASGGRQLLDSARSPGPSRTGPSVGGTSTGSPEGPDTGASGIRMHPGSGGDRASEISLMNLDLGTPGTGGSPGSGSAGEQRPGGGRNDE